ncbi:DASH family cryptochrome [Vibrio sp. ZSDZ65]|uniref:Cryptochrome DASH n=1 Tax=Vibrio qingdaonensis TaxID=2829491 RepID=A0A9X3CM33_9VIBR|nr:DASH family cryptochrome [Vibrio qingdaonensis]MCW8345912.1 DASH family cryptochrome [Vibrio qingdaonensis]
MAEQIGLYWFHNDMRLHDNRLLLQASIEMTRIHCVHVDTIRTHFESRFSPIICSGQAKAQFIHQSRAQLSASLVEIGQVLHLIHDKDLSQIIGELVAIISRYRVTTLYVALSSSWYVEFIVSQIRIHCTHIHITRDDNATLFQQEFLPFEFNSFPSSFSRFKKQVETLEVNAPSATVTLLPPPVQSVLSSSLERLPTSCHNQLGEWVYGGEDSGLRHVQAYFGSRAASSYKQTRNELDDWASSTKFSLWLANGNVSPRTILAQLRAYEARYTANESTYWIFFELLWREYFFWYSKVYGTKLFAFEGVQGKKPLTTYNASLFRQWVHGTTAFPIVNACMKQLNTTGYMSNRGRQLAASCLVHELRIDWRFGASYFQQALIDYDVGANWGNWQYIAGVGSAARASHRFDLHKQTQRYDPERAFIMKWRGDSSQNATDVVDASDWPIGEV